MQRGGPVQRPEPACIGHQLVPLSRVDQAFEERVLRRPNYAASASSLSSSASAST